MAIYVLYNPKAGNGAGEQTAQKLKDLYPNDELFFRNVTEMGNIPGFLDALGSEDRVILCGGDGTLNHFVNDLDGYVPQNEILFYAAGTGNDFMNDLGKPADADPFAINPYLVDLPTVTVNGMTRRFINGIGYGIDGYCCEVGDELRAKSDKPINYTSIAIKGLLFHYKPCDATVTVDGRTETFRRVWLASTMFGKCYGGNMRPTPDQDRSKPDQVSVIVYHSCGKLKALMSFPDFSAGKQAKHTDIMKIFTGKEVTVTFSAPQALQIDGETVRNVTTYSVKAAK